MSNNNRRGAPSNYPEKQRYPERQRNDREGQAESQPYYPQSYPYPPRNYKDQNEQMGRAPAYNPQMHYNNFYYQQYHPQYPPPYPNAYPQYYPHPQYVPYPHNPSPNPNPNPNPSPNQHKEPSASTPEKKNSARKEESWQQDDRRQQEDRRQQQDRSVAQKPIREERKPQQERKPYQEERRSYQQEKYEPRYEQREGGYNNRSRRHEGKQEKGSQQSNQVGFTSQSDSESQEVIYRRKAIVKKKDPVLDSKQQIRKWLEARKRNYPKRSMGEQETQARAEAGELSILQKKIRKKILLINADTKSLMKKQKDIDILRRFILYSRKNKRPVIAQRSNNPQPLVREMVGQEEAVRVEEPVKELPKEEVIEPMEPVQQVEPTEPVQEIEQGAVVQLPIKSEKPAIIESTQYQRREQLSVDVIVKHLQMKQAQDAKTLSSLLDYKSNSFHFRYQHQTLETNLLLDNIFNQTSYILQAIRYIVNNKFFDQPAQ